MSRFINYQNIDFRINGQIFYATQIAITAQSSVSPVLLNDGTLLNYAPENAVIGSLSCDFYLTGAVPAFLNITGSSETAISASFAGVTISNVYSKSLSFSVEPFKPILMSVDFDWYGNIDSESFASQSLEEKRSKELPIYVANGYKSYLNTNNLNGVGNILTFSYNSSAERIAYFKVGEKIPFRACKINKKASVKLNSDNLGEILDINGRSVSTVIYLKDLYGTSLNDFSINGVMINQNYSIAQGQYMMSMAEITQQIGQAKTII